MQGWFRELSVFSLLVWGLSGCGSLPVVGIDWQSHSEIFARKGTKAEIQPREIANIINAPKRDQILESRDVSGVAERLEKQEVILADKQVQQAKVKPLVERLRTMSERDVLQMLGQPMRQIRQGPMIIWQYMAEQCQWDLYFRVNPSGQMPTLRDLIVHDRGDIITDDDRIAHCEAGLLNRQSA